MISIFSVSRLTALTHRRVATNRSLRSTGFRHIGLCCARRLIRHYVIEPDMTEIRRTEQMERNAVKRNARSETE
jgi:hypothetical protein